METVISTYCHTDFLYWFQLKRGMHTHSFIIKRLAYKYYMLPSAVVLWHSPMSRNSTDIPLRLDASGTTIVKGIIFLMLLSFDPSVYIAYGPSFIFVTSFSLKINEQTIDKNNDTSTFSVQTLAWVFNTNYSVKMSHEPG